MQNVLTALIPIFVLILAGFVLRQRRCCRTNSGCRAKR